MSEISGRWEPIYSIKDDIAKAAEEALAEHIEPWSPPHILGLAPALTGCQVYDMYTHEQCLNLPTHRFGAIIGCEHNSPQFRVCEEHLRVVLDWPDWKCTQCPARMRPTEPVPL